MYALVLPHLILLLLTLELYRFGHASASISQQSLVRDHSLSSLQISEREVNEVRLSAMLTHLREKYHLPGFAVAFGDPTRVKTAIGSVRRRDRRVEVYQDDLWHLGSNTKAITAMVVATLIEEGCFSWTSTLADILLDIGMLSQYKGVTIEELLSHRSGINDDGINRHIPQIARTYTISSEQGRTVLTKIKLSTPSSINRGDLMYSNMNYIIAGKIIDLASHTPAELVFQKRIFEPLGLTSAHFSPLSEHSLISIDNPWSHIETTMGPIPFGIGIPPRYRDEPPPVNTAGLLHMSATDYNRWLLANLNQDPALGLCPETFTKLYTAYPAPGQIEEQCGRTYGGWRRCNNTDDDTYVLSHDGSNGMNYASALIDTQSNRTFAALTNYGSEGAMRATREIIKFLRCESGDKLGECDRTGSNDISVE